MEHRNNIPNSSYYIQSMNRVTTVSHPRINLIENNNKLTIIYRVDYSARN